MARRHFDRLLAVALILGLLGDVAAVTRMPDEFNIEKDWDEKQRWMEAKPHIRCELCRVLVDSAFETIGENFQEDDVYDFVDKICDAEEIYDKHELVQNNALEPPNSLLPKWLLVPAESERTGHTIRWQSHAMKENCDNIIRPNDDEIKDTFLKAKRRAAKKKLAGMGNRTQVVQQACEAARLCKPGEKQGVRAAPETTEVDAADGDTEDIGELYDSPEAAAAGRAKATAGASGGEL